MSTIVLKGDNGSTITLNPPSSVAFTFGGIIGPVGNTGATGPTGATGAGVPTGGTSGQVLTKNSSTNYDDSWVTPTAAPVFSVAGRTGAITLGESDITNLTTDLAAKAPLASPTLTGTPTAPTASNGTNTTQIATTAFVKSAVTAPTFSYVAKTTTYAILTSDDIVDCTSGTFTVTLPTAVTVTGKTYNIKNSGTGVITIATTSAQTIDGGATATLKVQYVSVTVVSDGSNWKVI